MLKLNKFLNNFNRKKRPFIIKFLYGIFLFPVILVYSFCESLYLLFRSDYYSFQHFSIQKRNGTYKTSFKEHLKYKYKTKLVSVASVAVVIVSIVVVNLISVAIYNPSDIEKAQAAGASLYVDATGGVDSGDCQTEVSPCLTINYAIGQASNGDTVYIADGTYDEEIDVVDKSVTLDGESRSGTIINPTTDYGNAETIFFTPADDYDMEIKDLKVVPYNNSDYGITISNQADTDYLYVTIDNVWIDQAKYGVYFNAEAWNDIYTVQNSLITNIVNYGVYTYWFTGNRINATADNNVLYNIGSACFREIRNVMNNTCTGAYEGIYFSTGNSQYQNDPFIANNAVINSRYTGIYVNNSGNANQKCGRIINNTVMAIGDTNYGVIMDCYTAADDTTKGLLYNNIVVDSRYGFQCAGGPMDYDNNATNWVWWEDDSDGYGGSTCSAGDVNGYHTEEIGGNGSGYPGYDYEEDGGGDDITWTVSARTCTTATVNPDPGWTTNQWAGQYVAVQDAWYHPFYIVSNTSDTITIGAYSGQCFTNMPANQVMQLDVGDWIKIYDTDFPNPAMSSNLVDTGYDPTSHVGGRLSAGEYTHIKDSWNSVTRPYDAKGLSPYWDIGASEVEYLHSVYDAPTITSPPATIYNISGETTVTISNTLTGEDYGTHASTDWHICTDASCNTKVYTNDNDAVNLYSFAYPAGTINALTANTQYWFGVSVANQGGDSDISTVAFYTPATGIPTETWHFTSTGDYTYNASYLEVAQDAGNTYVRLEDLGGGVYGNSVNNNSKKLPITITNSGGELTNYQIRMEIAYDADMQVDFDDIRFTAVNGYTVIDHWIESYTASTSAVVWIEVPTITASGDTTIYMYYGNSGASSSGSISDTFVLADDFNDESLDTTNTWTWVENGTSPVYDEGTTQTDWLNIETLTKELWQGTNNAPVLRSQSQISGDFEAFVRIQMSPTTNWQRAGIFVYSDNDNYINSLRGYANGQYVRGIREISASGQATSVSASATDLYLKMRKVGTTYTSYYSLDNSNWTQIRSDASISLTNKYIALVSESYVSGGGGLDVLYDNVYVRKYTATEPTTSTIDTAYYTANEAAAVSYADLDVYPQAGISYNTIYALAHSLSGTNEGTVAYQVSSDCSNWKYFSNGALTAVSNDATDNNTITEINSYLRGLTSPGTFCFKAFLISDGTQKVELDSITLDYNGVPTAPTTLYSNNTDAQSGSVNPDNLTDETPVFSALYNDDAGDTGKKYCIEVDTQADFAGTDMWFSDGAACANGVSITDVTSGNRAVDKEYAGSALTCGTTYYWREKFWDNLNVAGAWSAAAQFEINCTPVTADDTSTGDEDTDQNIDLSHTDGDSDTVTYAVVADVNNGTLTQVDANLGTFTYTPNDNFNGTDTFTYKVNDGTEDSNTSTMTITVNNTNDGPEITGFDATITIDEGALVEMSISTSDLDNDTPTLTASADGLETSDIFTDNGDGTGDFSWQTDYEDAGNYLVTFTADDGVDQASAGANIIVNDVVLNEDPVFGDESVPYVATYAGITTSALFDLDEYFSDPDGDALTYSMTGTDEFTANITDGVVTFTIPEDYTGTAGVNFVATDPSNATATSNAVVVTVSELVENGIDHLIAEEGNVVEIYDDNGELITSFTAFSKGGVIPRLGNTKNDSYIYCVKRRSGSSIRVFTLTGQKIMGKVISPRLHWRTLATGSLDKNKNNEEIVIGTKRGSTIYLKVFSYYPDKKKKKRFKVRKKRKFKPVKKAYRLKIKNKKVRLIMNKTGKVRLKWKAFK